MQYVTTAERIGIQKGRHDGRQEGRQETQRELLEQLLAVRFGPLPDLVETRLAEAESVQLAAWFQRGLELLRLKLYIFAKHEQKSVQSKDRRGG
uniref:hypothetical protein n=1 Tax=uncultured Thiodictyon sp. TaxID=1846217 RepID=UPI0025E3BB40